MVTLAAVALTCLLCSMIALPRKPLPNNEVQELVYARLLGRQHLLMLLALVATAGAFLTLVAIARPSHSDPAFNTVRHPNASCVQGSYDPVSCATPQSGIRVVRVSQGDGTTPRHNTGYTFRSNFMTEIAHRVLTRCAACYLCSV